MGSYYALRRVTVCDDDGTCFDVRCRDIAPTEMMEKKGVKSRLLGKTTNNGSFFYAYVPKGMGEPSFEPEGADLIASRDDGKVMANHEIIKAGDTTRSGISCHKYKVEKP